MHSSLSRVTSEPHTHSPGRQQPTRLTTLLTHTLAHDDQVEPRRTRRLFGTSYPSSAPEISPSSSLRSPYSSKTNRTIARRAGIAAHQLSTAVCRPECEGARMVHAFAIELLWPFTRPEGSPASVTVTVHSVSKMVIWCASITLGPYSSSYLCAPRPYISLILDPIALPPSPTSPSPTQASSTTPMLSMATLVINMCVLPSFVSYLSA